MTQQASFSPESKTVVLIPRLYEEQDLSHPPTRGISKTGCLNKKQGPGRQISRSDAKLVNSLQGDKTITGEEGVTCY